MAELLAEELVDAVYRVVLDPGAWGDVMRLVERRFPSTAQTFYFLHREPRRVQPVCLAGVETARLASFDGLYFAPDNPWIRLTERLHRPGIVRTNERLDALLRERGVLYRSAYYNEWMRPQGFKYSIGNTLLSDGGLVANITLFRPPDMPTFDADEVRAFETLSTHMTRALQMAMRLDRPHECASVAAALAALPQPVALIDRRRRLLHANAAMEALLRAQGGLALRGHAIAASSAQSAAAFDAHVTRAAAGDAAAAPESLALADGAGGHVTLQCVPLPGRADSGTPTPPTLLLMVTECPCEPAAGDAAIRGFYGCTRAEARLARELADGRGLRDAAAAIGVTYETARAYLKAVFAKTGVHTQAQLVALVLRGRRARALNG